MRGIVAVIGIALSALAVSLILNAFIEWRLATGFPVLVVGLYLIKDALSK